MSREEGGRRRLYCAINNVYIITVILLLLMPADVHCLNWLQVKIVWLDIDYECFKHSCIETKLRFVVKEAILEHSFCWPINVAGIVHPVDSYFVPNEPWLNFTVEIAGKDPMYNFPRVCDRSEVEDLPVPTIYSAVFPRGRCFNATVTVQPAKFDSQDVTSVSKLMANTSGGAGSHNDYPLISSYFLAGLTPVPLWVVFILASLNILLLISIVILLFLSRRKRRKDALREFELAVSRTASEETRYEMPWEQKYRPLPSYLKELQQGTIPRGPSSIVEETTAMPVINANV